MQSWRDVRWLLARSARPVDLSPEKAEPSVMNAQGFHPRVGFGRIHAGDSISEARNFAGLPAEKRCVSGVQQVDQAIDDSPAPALITTTRFQACDLKIVESVEVTLTVDHAYVADLDVVLISPSGTRSQLARPHSCPASQTAPCGDLSSGWTFTSVRHMGESLQGSAQNASLGQLQQGWQIQVKDGQTNDTGRWRSFQMVITGH
jgi:kexin